MLWKLRDLLVGGVKDVLGNEIYASFMVKYVFIGGFDSNLLYFSINIFFVTLQWKMPLSFLKYFIAFSMDSLSALR